MTPFLESNIAIEKIPLPAVPLTIGVSETNQLKPRLF
jgi:hypothetical protein